MINRKHFYDTIRKSIFSGKLTADQVKGMNPILDEWEAQGLTDLRWLAYMLATAFHETAGTMQPIEEYGKGRGRDYGKRLKMSRKPYTDTPAIFYGRGYVQLTWYENYEKAGKLLGLDLLGWPEVVMTQPTATKILFMGMREGWFTGKRLSDYFNDKKEDWANARRIINHTDKAALIADYGRKFHAALTP